MSLSPLWGVPGGCSLAGGYALFWSPVYEPPDLCRYQPHLSEAIEDSPELWPRHKAHGSIRVPEGQPIQMPHSSSGRARTQDRPPRAPRNARHSFSEVAGAST